MSQRNHVVDLVKVAFVVLIIKVTALYSALMPWSSLVDNLCIVFVIGVTFAKLTRLTMPLGRLLTLAILSLFALYTCVTMGQYDLLVKEEKAAPIEGIILSCPGSVELPELGLKIICEFASEPVLTRDAFTVNPKGQMVIRSRQPGDRMRLQGGTRELKKLFIDRKIPAAARASCAAKRWR